MIEGSYSARENEKLNRVVLIMIRPIQIHLHAVNYHLVLFLLTTLSLAFEIGLGLDLKALASGLTSLSPYQHLKG